MLSFLLLSFFALVVQSLPVVRTGYDLANTRDFPSLVNKRNVDSLQLEHNFTMCGSATSTPLVLFGRVCVADFGGCYTCWNLRTGSLIFRKNISADYGFAPGAFVRVTPTFSDGVVVLATYGRPLIPGQGAYAFAVTFVTGAMVWNTTLSTFPWAIVTQSILIEGGRVHIGTSSQEAAAPLQPGYQCCSFVGSMYLLSLNTGAILSTTPMIPPGISGPGLFSGAAIWGPMATVGRHIYVGTGQLYHQMDNSSACLLADPNNVNCVPPTVHFDSIVRLDTQTNQITKTFRAQAGDCWNIACFFNGAIPGCQPGPAYDYDITNVMYSARQKMIFATSKSGITWALDENLNFIWAQSVIRGSAAGGHTFPVALEDARKKSDMGIYVPNTNGANVWYMHPNGTNITNGAGAWSKYDGNGNVKWITPSPSLNRVYGGTTFTNNVVFGSTYKDGILVALDSDSGAFLWQYQTHGAMTGVPAVVGPRLIWPTGPGTIFTPGSLVDQHDLLVFKLTCEYDDEESYDE